jgi:hypothetical protein
MTRRCWKVVGLWLLVPVVLLAGCAAGGGYYPGGAYTGAGTSDIPPVLRNTDPSLSQWYSPPYFNPYEMP